MKLPYYIWFQILSLVMALIYYRQIRLFGLQMMVPLLFLVCCVEIVATTIAATNIRLNVYVYNFYLLVSPVFYFLLFLNMIGFKKFKRLYILASAFCLLFFIYDFFFLEPGGFNKYSMMTAMIAYLILSCIVLSQIVMDETRRIQLISEPYFWITTGIIIFGLVSVVVLGLYPFIARNGIKIGGKNIYQVIMPIANVVMYTSFAFAFYLCKNYSAKYQIQFSQASK